MEGRLCFSCCIRKGNVELCYWLSSCNMEPPLSIRDVKEGHLYRSTQQVWLAFGHRDCEDNFNMILLNINIIQCILYIYTQLVLCCTNYYIFIWIPGEIMVDTTHWPLPAMVDAIHRDRHTSGTQWKSLIESVAAIPLKFVQLQITAVSILRCEKQSWYSCVVGRNSHKI